MYCWFSLALSTALLSFVFDMFGDLSTVHDFAAKRIIDIL